MTQRRQWTTALVSIRRSIFDCCGACLNDADEDGTCDEFEVAGCTDSSACNYSSAATDDDGSCTYTTTGYDCDGNCLVDTTAIRFATRTK